MMDSEFHAVVETLMRQTNRDRGPARTVTSVAVIGAGPLGQSLACSFLASGHRVKLFSALGAELDALREAGGITVRGATLSGTYRVAERAQREPAIELVANADTAVRDVDVVLIAAPAWTQQVYAGLLAGQLRGQQTVVLISGGFLASVAFDRVLRRWPAAADVSIAELDLPPYLVSGTPGNIFIHAVARRCVGGALPGGAAESLVEALVPTLPRLVPAASVLEVAFGGIIPLLRTIPILLSASEVERARAESREPLLRDLLTPGVAATVVERVDNERRRVAFRYGIRDLPRVAEVVANAFGGEGNNLAEVVRSSEAFDEFAIVTGTGGGPHVADDVAYGLVPLTSAGRVAGVSTPVTDSLVGVASALADVDFVREGATLASLGLAAGLTDGESASPEELRHLLDTRARPVATAPWQVS